MAITSLSRMDLNLLVALQVLIEERNVTRAAERLFITQPAMSKTLQRLRDLFDDPLFTRSGRGLMPTPRALELEQQLPEVLGKISALVANQDFDPKTFEGELHLAGPEFISLQLLPALARRITHEAPNISIAVSSGMENYLEALADGELDFVFEIEKRLPEEYKVTRLGGFTPAVWMRRGHPLENEEMTLSAMLEYPFVQYFLLITDVVSTHTASRFDRTLAGMGLKRKRVLVTDQLMTALDTLHSTDCLMLATMHDLQLEADFYDIVRKPYPKEIKHDPFLPVNMVQHTRTCNSAFHRWFTEQATSVVECIKNGGENC